MNIQAQLPGDSEQQPTAQSVQAAQALIGRLIPKHTSQFILEMIPAENGKDVFEIDSKDGKIALRGNSALSMAVGLHWYLKYTCHCQVSLNGNQLALPEPLPAVKEKVRQVGWAKSRYFLNYCTFAYSMPWWDWAQWEKFIDWMALIGINQPLAITGQEAVWEAVGKRFGMTDAEIELFLAGPPYLPFQWMGCLDSHGGPLPKNWISRRAELGKQILARERALGMTPVLQGGTGHLPEATIQLRDYSRREWSGLISGFYAKRWTMYFDQQTAVLAGAPPPADDMVKFEYDWASQRETYPAKPQGDTVAVAQRLFDKYQ